MTKISSLTELLGAGVDQSNDLLTIVDMSETGAARNKKIKITQLLGLVTDIAGLLDFKGSTDCSANPNYPAASKGDYYLVSVAGKIGGASGIDVKAGDTYFAIADNAGGTQAAVGTSWTVVEGNLIVDNDTTLAGDSAANVPSQHAVKTYVDSSVGGVVSFASIGETSAGTEAGKAVTPDGLAGSIFGTRTVSILVSDPSGSAITTGDGKAYWRVPSTCNGMNLVAVAAALTTVSSSGIPTVQIANVTDSVDMLSTKLTIDANETDSSTAAAAAVIDTAHDDVATGDMLRIDIDVAGTGAKGLMVEMQFQIP